VVVCVLGPDSPEPPGFGERGNEVSDTIEKAAQVELGRLPADLRSSTLAVVVLDLARRLDAEPEDRSASMLSRELRLVLAELHARAGDVGGGEVERYLESIASPALRGPGN
jgi:hypothetical protein